MNLQLLTRRIRINLENAQKALEIYKLSADKAIEDTEKATEELRKMNVRLKMRVVK